MPFRTPGWDEGTCRQVFAVLIDSTHRKWFLGTAIVGSLALAVYLLWAARTPGGLTGGSFLGLWYGVLGSALMVYAGMLSALRKVPRWTWLGARKTWLRGHIWLGLLSCVFLLCHSGFHLGGPLEFSLWIIYLLVLVTGIYGLFMQWLMPRMITVRVPCEAPYEQIPHICLVMRQKADDLVDAICGPHDPGAAQPENTMGAVQFATSGKLQLREFYERDVRPFLDPRVPREAPLLNPLIAESRFSKVRALPDLVDARDSIGELARLCEERRSLAIQTRLYFWLHSWLLVHIPLSVALLVLGVAHVVTALFY